MAARRRRTERVPAAILAALWLVAPALSLVHALEGQHRYCGEHRVFEEEDAAKPGDHACPERHVESTSEREDGHQACAFQHLGARDTSLDSRQSVVAAPPIDAGDAAIPQSPDGSPIAVLAVAPKNSPPDARL